MTAGTDLARPEDFADFDFGLEDLKATDISFPRIRILHDEGVFMDSVTKRKSAVLDCIIIGMVKQRIFWDADADLDESEPLCKSPGEANPRDPNSRMLGFPNIHGKEDFRFPWEGSNFDPDDWQPDDNGVVRLPCDACAYAQWRKNPKKKDKNDPPLCNEQYTLVIMYRMDDEDQYIPGIFTVQKTGIGPAKAYLGAFKQRQQPPFLTYTSVTLNEGIKGGRKFQVPQFEAVQGAKTEREEWAGFAKTFGAIREYVTVEPRVRDDSGDAPRATRANTGGYVPRQAEPVQDIVDAEVEEDVTPAAPAPAPAGRRAAPPLGATKAAAPAASAPAPQAAASTDDDDDDGLPF